MLDRRVGKMESVIVEDFAIVVHDHATPRDADWQRWIATYTNSLATLRGLLVFSHGGGPDAAQRNMFVERTKSWEATPPTAIVTNSTIMRGLVTALHWFLPPQRRSLLFAPEQLEQAFDHLRVPHETRPLLRDVLELTRDKLARRASMAS